ncbi:efflux RND transporter permease subunit [Hydrogenimonas urashimensis]|uniref:efflux RND transporter permease subunit n=1 Tax=Hydrogenimonas urashimensis TaxID=2740515 RepID=UPI001F301D83|nr:efflux RND transporter permease subunit [Hydrogenimonas urashimensis]
MTRMRFIEYFLTNKRLNHVLLLFILIAGINAYRDIPKELFPDVTLDMIDISGGYPGSSAKILDKMAVRDIEDAIEGISGIETTETIIVPGRFDIIVTLADGADAIDVLNKVKDAIAASRQYLPADMVEPVATLLTRKRDLLSLSLASKTLDRKRLIDVAKRVKRTIMHTEGIAEVRIYGDSDEEILVKIDSDAVAAYGISPKSLLGAISHLSYIYPVGNIEEPGNYVFLSTVHGKKDPKAWEDARLTVDGKTVRLGEVAKVTRRLAQSATLSSFNTLDNVTLKIYKASQGDAIALSKTLRKLVERLKKRYPEVVFDIYHDSSIPIKKRLDVIVSNIMFGLILIFVTMTLLVNFRIAAIVTMGIPFSFAIGLLFIYYTGYTINIVSLLGALIVIGIVVDDAVVVAENIQRYIDEGMERHLAVLRGVREMILPVTLATVTTVVAFLPLFLLSGEISHFIILIPIVVIMVLLGSLIESFLFLPLHAKEFLRQGGSVVDWRPLQKRYERSLIFIVRHKKLFLALFIVGIPLATFLMIKQIHFQFFPSFDSRFIYVTGRTDLNTPIEKTHAVAKEIEAVLLKHRKELGLKSVSAVAGSRTTMGGENEKDNGSFYVTLELYDLVDTDWINRYLNPILNLSFDFNDPEKRRRLTTYELAGKIEMIIAPFRERYHLEELGVRQRHIGVIRNDIKINFSGSDDETIVEAMERVKKALAAVPGVRGVSDNLQYGKMEWQIRVNDYGESLGLTEGDVARLLSGYFLTRRQAMTFGKEGVVEIRTEETYKDDLKRLEDFDYPLPNGRYVKLKEIADFVKSRDFMQIKKRDAEVVKTVFATIDKQKTTANDVLDAIVPLLESVKAEGVKIHLMGEKEKNRQLAKEMKHATVVALFLILIALLLIFSKIKYALMVMSVIPFSILGALAGHLLLGINLSMPSVIGILGLAGVVVNDGIIMLDFLHGTHDAGTFFNKAVLRLRPILITSITTFLGLFTLIFFATGQAVILQPIAVAIGFGLIWGTMLNLFYLPTLYAVVNRIEMGR